MPSRQHFHSGHMKGLLYKDKTQGTGCLPICWEITFFIALCPTHLISSWISDPDFDKKKICNRTISHKILSYELSGTCGSYTQNIGMKNREASTVRLHWETLLPSREADVRISECVLSTEETDINQFESSFRGNLKRLAITQ